MAGPSALTSSPETPFAPAPLEEFEPHTAPRPWSRVYDAARRRLFSPRERVAPPPPSNYLTLIPLSDSRLQPRDPRVTVVGLLGFALVVAAAVFMTVPRGLYAGEVFVQPDAMSWNTSKSTYQLRLETRIPVYNPNYLGASIEGSLKVLFYRAEAGQRIFGPVRLAPRALPSLLDVPIDASDVPLEYVLSILSQCSTFPEMLIFFLRGELGAKYLFQEQKLTAIDTYFLIDCKSGGTVPPLEADDATRTTKETVADDRATITTIPERRSAKKGAAGGADGDGDAAAVAASAATFAATSAATTQMTFGAAAVDAIQVMARMVSDGDASARASRAHPDASPLSFPVGSIDLVPAARAALQGHLGNVSALEPRFRAWLERVAADRDAHEGLEGASASARAAETFAAGSEDSQKLDDAVSGEVVQKRVETAERDAATSSFARAVAERSLQEENMPERPEAPAGQDRTPRAGSTSERSASRLGGQAHASSHAERLQAAHAFARATVRQWRQEREREAEAALSARALGSVGGARSRFDGRKTWGGNGNLRR